MTQVSAQSRIHGYIAARELERSGMMRSRLLGSKQKQLSRTGISAMVGNPRKVCDAPRKPQRVVGLTKVMLLCGKEHRVTDQSGATESV